MSVQCRECGRELDESEVRMVAHWPFCPDCFQKLLEKREKPPTPEGTPVQEEVVKDTHPQVSAPTTAACSLCGREMDRSLLKKIGIWLFCPQCSADMVERSGIESPEELGTPSGDEGKAAEAPDAPVPGAVAQLPPGFVRFVHCAGCGRRIPEGGSKTIEGKPFCPDCYYSMVQTPPNPADSTGPMADAPSSGETPPEDPNSDEGGE